MLRSSTSPGEMCPAAIRLRSHCAAYGSFSLKYAAKAFPPFCFTSSPIGANSALTTAIVWNQKVVAIQFMPALAVSLAGVAAHFCIAAMHIHSMRDGLQVIRIDAPRILATVVNFRSFWDWSAVQTIGNAMCLLGPLTIPHLPIPSRLMRPKPYPAARHGFGHALVMKSLEQTHVASSKSVDQASMAGCSARIWQRSI